MSHCTGCGRPEAEDEHSRCKARRASDPPRFCAECGRRMVVQVTPMSWRATCSRHGSIGARPVGQST